MTLQHIFHVIFFSNFKRVDVFFKNILIKNSSIEPE